MQDILNHYGYSRQNLIMSPDSLVYTENVPGVCEMTLKRTRLCYWIARSAKPGVQSNNTSRAHFAVISYTPGRSRFYHIHIVSKRNWGGACLMNLTQQSYLFFKFAICSIALLNLGETCHLKGSDKVTQWRTLLLLRWYDCHAVWTLIVT